MPNDLCERLRRVVQVHFGLGSTIVSQNPDGSQKVVTDTWDDGKRLHNPDGPEAAAEIERLQTTITQLKSERDEALGRVEALEETLSLIADGWKDDDPVERLRIVRERARTALSESKRS